MWIEVKVGSGKSTIMKLAHLKLLSTVAKQPPHWSGVTSRRVATPVVVAFFFTAQGTSIE
jgi:hypothetical protein